MDFYRHFLICTYLMIFIGATSLTLAEGSPFYVVTAFTGLGVAWLLARHGRVDRLSKRAATAWSFTAAGFMVVDYVIISQAMPLAFAHFLLAIQMIKVFSVKTDRDYVQLYTISFIHLALASIMTIDLSFALAFLCYMIAATWGLTLFHLKRSAEHFLLRRELTHEEKFSPGQAPRGPLRQLHFSPRPFYGGSVTSTLVTLAFTVTLFSIFPRLNTRFFALKYSGAGQAVSGFSEQVEFGQINSIKLDDTPVMSVKYLTPPEHYTELYLKGLTYAKYDGKGWSSPHTTSEPCVRDYSMFLSPEEKRVFKSPPGGHFTCRIAMEHLNIRTLFHIGAMQSVTFTSGLPNRLMFNPVDETYAMDELPREEVRYEFKSLDLPMDADAIGPAPSRLLKPDLQTEFTAFPKMATDQEMEIRQLANTILQRPKLANATDFLKAQAIETYLGENYRYTLEPSPTPGRDPVYDFLFFSKRGHCEYFASAMVILCRALNMPSRLVAGYRGGELNEMGQFYQIAQYNAHAWVEVYFDQHGWIPFDPTPADDTPARTLWKQINNYVAYLQYSWDEFVIDYSWKEQQRILAWAREKFEDVKNSALDVVRHAMAGVAWLQRGLRRYLPLVVLFLPMALAALWKYRRPLWRYLQVGFRPAHDGPAHSSIPFFEDLMALLAAQGYPKLPQETGHEFSRRVQTGRSDAYAGLDAVIGIYYDVRYGGDVLTDGQRGVIKDYVARVRALTANRS